MTSAAVYQYPKFVHTSFHVIFTGRIYYLLLVLFIFVTTNDAAPLPQLSDLVRARPHVFYTIARQYDSLEFLCNGRKTTLLWILPNNEIIELNQTTDSNRTIEFRKSKIVITPVRFKTNLLTCNSE
jgi:hypothetical protein